MAIAISINEKEYLFNLSRENYRKYVLEDYEYSAIQNKLAKLSMAKGITGESEGEIAKSVAEVILENDVLLMREINMIEQEKIFFASLVENYPKITQKESNDLLDKAISEYGTDEVALLCKDLTANFIPVGEKSKKKMVRRVV